MHGWLARPYMFDSAEAPVLATALPQAETVRTRAEEMSEHVDERAHVVRQAVEDALRKGRAGPADVRGVVPEMPPVEGARQQGPGLDDAKRAVPGVEALQGLVPDALKDSIPRPRSLGHLLSLRSPNSILVRLRAAGADRALDVEHHHDEHPPDAKSWDELAEEEKEAWRRRLLEAGVEWVVLVGAGAGSLLCWAVSFFLRLKRPRRPRFTWARASGAGGGELAVRESEC